MTYKLSRFSFNDIERFTSTVIVGPRCSGKTTYMLKFLTSSAVSKYDNICVVTNKDSTKSSYKSLGNLNLTCVNDLNDIEPQTQDIIILEDDCSQDMLKSNELMRMVMSPKTYKLTLFIISQSPAMLKPNIRANINYLCIAPMAAGMKSEVYNLFLQKSNLFSSDAPLISLSNHLTSKKEFFVTDFSKCYYQPMYDEIQLQDAKSDISVNDSSDDEEDVNFDKNQIIKAKEILADLLPSELADREIHVHIHLHQSNRSGNRRRQKNRC